eukprot:Lithocolla_globosa_v1_NODE_7451_length_946_cov_6.226712.p1 type:complete len:162 gc:universal NODE_7451_length_946_cov_6.226712:75-560(+)
MFKLCRLICNSVSLVVFTHNTVLNHFLTFFGFRLSVFLVFTVVLFSFCAVPTCFSLAFFCFGLITFFFKDSLYTRKLIPASSMLVAQFSSQSLICILRKINVALPFTRRRSIVPNPLSTISVNPDFTTDAPYHRNELTRTVECTQKNKVSLQVIQPDHHRH